MKVYRFEHRHTRLGPYRHLALLIKEGGVTGLYRELHNKVKRHSVQSHPFPSDDFDFNRTDDMHYMYGCKSLDDLIDWFAEHEMFETIKRIDEFNLCVYETEDYQIGLSDRQVRFNGYTAALSSSIMYRE